MELNVYVPRSGHVTSIDPGSGIVGAVEESGRLTVDYEGNRNRASNIRTYADRVLHAHGRHTVRYPTIARQSVPVETMIWVGTFDDHTHTFDLGGGELPEAEARELLAAWCALAAGDLDAELVCTDPSPAERGRIRDMLSGRHPLG